MTAAFQHLPTPEISPAASSYMTGEAQTRVITFDPFRLTLFQGFQGIKATASNLYPGVKRRGIYRVPNPGLGIILLHVVSFSYLGISGEEGNSSEKVIILTGQKNDEQSDPAGQLVPRTLIGAHISNYDQQTHRFTPLPSSEAVLIPQQFSMAHIVLDTPTPVPGHP